MEKRVTIRDIAARAGLHYSSVSLALRGDTRIPEATRTRIRKLAEKMGYVPDPALAALAAYRTARRPKEIHSELAYLTDRDRSEPFAETTYRYARERAEKLGYQLVRYTLTRSGPDLARMQEIWWSRGVRGVMIGPFAAPEPLEKVSWDRWPVVAYGYSTPRPAFNRALLDHFENTMLHLAELRARGYSRVGLCLLDSIERYTAGRVHAAYIFDQSQHPDPAPAPVLAQGVDDADVLEDWIRGNRLDAIIAYHEQHDMLRARGWRFPRDLGFSLLTRKSYEPEPTVRFSGFDTKAEVLAANTIHFLVSLIHEQACGILETPRHYMISGTFHEGATLRRRRRHDAKTTARPGCSTI
jgi:Transcriptional regulators